MYNNADQFDLKWLVTERVSRKVSFTSDAVAPSELPPLEESLAALTAELACESPEPSSGCIFVDESAAIAERLRGKKSAPAPRHVPHRKFVMKMHRYADSSALVIPKRANFITPVLQSFARGDRNLVLHFAASTRRGHAKFSLYINLRTLASKGLVSALICDGRNKLFAHTATPATFDILCKFGPDDHGLYRVRAESVLAVLVELGLAARD